MMTNEYPIADALLPMPTGSMDSFINDGAGEGLDAVVLVNLAHLV